MSSENFSSEQRIICGFWDRIIAYLIDTLILGTIGFNLGLLFFDFLVSLGGLGRYLGFLLALTYFSLLNSSLGKGQTLGKKLRKIKVVDRQGKLIPWQKSFIRFMILGLPTLLSGSALPFPQEFLQENNSLFLELSAIVFTILLSGIISAVPLVSFYLYIFNRRTRQTLHDLIVGTYVVKAQDIEGARFPRIWKGHVAIIFFLAGTVAFVQGLGVLSVLNIIKTPLGPVLEEAEQTSEEVKKSILSGKEFESIRYVNVTINTIWNNGKKTRELDINIYLKKKPESLQKMANKLTENLIDSYFDDEKAKEIDYVNIHFIYSLDLYVYQQSKDSHFSFSPEKVILKDNL